MKHPNITYMELTNTYIRCPSCETPMVPFQKTEEYDPDGRTQVVDNVEITCNTIRHIQVAQCPKCFKIWRTTLTDGHWTRKEK